MGPIAELTPGDLCHSPDRYRYPEHIAYCERDVSSELKDQIFNEYRRVGFRLPPNHRSSYKIDHFIPLCAGGSNEPENLWPQHLTIYKITDPVENAACKKLSEGKLSQRETIRLIIKAKLNLREASSVLTEISRYR